MGVKMNNEERKDEYSYFEPYESQSTYDATSSMSYHHVDTQDTQNIMSKTFLYMFVVLLISAFSAYYVAASNLVFALAGSRGTFFGFLIVELAVVFAAQWTMKKNLVLPSAVLLLCYALVNGATLSYIFLLYEMGSIISIFVMAAILFGALAAWGFVTKKDLTGIGQFGMMALIGVILLGIVNIFLRSSGVSLAIAAVGLAIFIGLTAYDTQKIKKMASENSSFSPNVIAMFGALMLYLDFINIFLYLLRLFGKRR